MSENESPLLNFTNRRAVLKPSFQTLIDQNIMCRSWRRAVSFGVFFRMLGAMLFVSTEITQPSPLSHADRVSSWDLPVC